MIFHRRDAEISQRNAEKILRNYALPPRLRDESYFYFHNRPRRI